MDLNERRRGGGEKGSAADAESVTAGFSERLVNRSFITCNAQCKYWKLDAETST